MKRGADNYMTKDSEPDDEIEEVPEEGFRKADDAVLATRKIRALPKRSMAGTPPLAAASNGTSTPEPSHSPTPKFNGFSGFGTPSSSFSFTPSLSPPPSFTNNSSSLSFPIPSSSSAPLTVPAVASTASTTAKAFASFLGNSPIKESKTTIAPDPLLRENSPSSSQTPITDDPATLNYYKSLRGLNFSLISAITKAFEDDPFNDVAEVLERYKSLRLNVQTKFDQSSKISTAIPPVVAIKPTAMPAPPSTFAGFGLSSSKPSITPGGNGGFVLSVPTTASTSGFTFPAPTPTPAIQTPGFSFNTPPASQSETQAPTNPFASSSSITPTFGTPTFKSSTSSAFGTPSTGISSPAPLTFGSTQPTATSNSLGATPSFNNSSISDKPASSRLFGNSPPSSKSNTFGGFGGFGNPAGNAGNPVGFGFGVPSGTPPEPEGPGLTEKASSTGDTNNQKDQSAENETKSPPVGSLFVTSPHDEEGEGEEQEDTVYAVKLKAYRLKKEDERGGTGWTELGYGVLRLKRHKATEARRMLLRNSSSGKININFNIYPGLKPSQVKKTLTFIGHDNGVSQTYNVRLQNEEQAANLKEALEKEIASVKSSSDS